MRGKDSAIIITQRKVPDRLIDPTSVTSIYRITDDIGCLMIGAIPDIKSQVNRLRYEANEFKYNYGYSCPVHVLANRMADLQQVFTQEASSRAMACIMLLIGYDEEKGTMTMCLLTPLLSQQIPILIRLLHPPPIRINL